LREGKHLWMRARELKYCFACNYVLYCELTQVVTQAYNCNVPFYGRKNISGWGQYAFTLFTIIPYDKCNMWLHRFMILKHLFCAPLDEDKVCKNYEKFDKQIYDEFYCDIYGYILTKTQYYLDSTFSMSFTVIYMDIYLRKLNIILNSHFYSHSASFSRDDLRNYRGRCRGFFLSRLCSPMGSCNDYWYWVFVGSL